VGWRERELTKGNSRRDVSGRRKRGGIRRIFDLSSERIHNEESAEEMRRTEIGTYLRHVCDYGFGNRWDFMTMRKTGVE
jgi:hypothetical protein